MLYFYLQLYLVIIVSYSSKQRAIRVEVKMILLQLQLSQNGTERCFSAAVCNTVLFELSKYFDNRFDYNRVKSYIAL